MTYLLPIKRRNNAGDPMHGNMLKKVLIGSGFIILAGGILFSILLFIRSAPSFMDDGPFHGEACITVPNIPSDQIFRIWNNMTLKIYDKKANLKSAVILLEKENKVLWCIYASGHDSSEVRSVRLSRKHAFLTSRPRVIGRVDWTYGNEAAWFFIAGNGELIEYWYSW